jgi:YD repeat-containing protein
LETDRGYLNDADGNVLTRKTRANETIGFAYDTLNYLTSKASPAPAPVVSHSYDLTGRLTSASDNSAAITAAVPTRDRNTPYRGVLAKRVDGRDKPGHDDRYLITANLPSFTVNRMRARSSTP